MFHYDLNDLLLLRAIADENNLTKGAAKVGLTAPSASSRLKKLEEALKVTIFRRTPKGVELTEPGKLVLEQARKVLWTLDELDNKLLPYTRQEKGVIKIFANYGACLDFLPKDIEGFFSIHPGVSFILEQKSSNDVVAAIVNGEADIGVSVLTQETTGLRVFPYKKDRLVVITRNDDVLADKEVISFKDLLDRNFVGLTQNSSMQRFLCGNAQKLNSKIKLKIQVDNPQIVCEMVESGVGIAIVLERSLGNYRKKLHVIKLEEAWANRDMRIILPAKEPIKTSVLRAFEIYLISLR